MSSPEILSKHFNRREVKWALRSDSADVARFLGTLPPLDAIKLTSQMFDELRCSDFPAFVMDCMEAVDRVEEHDDDRREMIDEICLVIDKFSATGKVVARRRINLAIATYFSLSRAAEISRMLCDELDLSDYNL